MCSADRLKFEVGIFSWFSPKTLFLAALKRFHDDENDDCCHEHGRNFVHNSKKPL